uniref:Thymidylate or Deoxyguanosine kinase n=1 Tax=Dikerogammarus haemobaphes virus 1 TaxID=2704946 RepID=A0A6G9HDS3_9VIRU|nr:thymidylate or Deoxyguanosine kinase [Dikerogammarus haemobaphes virus 1]
MNLIPSSTLPIYQINSKPRYSNVDLNGTGDGGYVKMNMNEPTLPSRRGCWGGASRANKSLSLGTPRDNLANRYQRLGLSERGNSKLSEHGCLSHEPEHIYETIKEPVPKLTTMKGVEFKHFGHDFLNKTLARNVSKGGEARGFQFLNTPSLNLKDDAVPTTNRSIGLGRNYALINVDGVTGSGKSYFIINKLVDYLRTKYPEYRVIVLDQSHILKNEVDGLPDLSNIFRDIKKKKYQSMILFQIKILLSLLERVDATIKTIDADTNPTKTFIIIEGGFVSGSYIYNKQIMPEVTFQSMSMLIDRIYKTSTLHREADLHIIHCIRSISETKRSIQQRGRKGESSYYTTDKLLKINTNVGNYYRELLCGTKESFYYYRDRHLDITFDNCIERIVNRVF